MGNPKKLVVISLALLLLLVPVMLGCGAKATGLKVVKIGWISGLTGPAASSNEQVLDLHQALVQYINADDPIPGVKLALEVYDTRYDPAKASLGYAKLKDAGVVAIVTGDPIVNDTVRPLLERDQIPMLSYAPSQYSLDPPSYTFAFAQPMECIADAFLEYIHETWDYAGKGRNPRLANMGWDMSFGKTHGVFAQAHAADFNVDFVDQELAPIGTMDMSVNLDHVANAGADYVMAAMLPAPFLSVMREANIRYPGQMVFMQTFVPAKALVDALGSELMEGVIDVTVVGSTPDLAGVQLMQSILTNYSPGYLDKWGSEMGIYMNVPGMMLLFEAMRTVVAQKGIDALTGENIYEAMQTVQVDTGGLLPGPLYYGTDRRYHTYGTPLDIYIAGTWEMLGEGKWYGAGFAPF
jgi:hypothetical protein